MCRREPESEPMARAARRQPQPKRPKEKMYIRYLAGHSEQRRHPEDTQDLPNYQWVDWVTHIRDRCATPGIFLGDYSSK